MVWLAGVVSLEFAGEFSGVPAHMTKSPSIYLDVQSIVFFIFHFSSREPQNLLIFLDNNFNTENSLRESVPMRYTSLCTLYAMKAWGGDRYCFQLVALAMSI
jgi:hypothetical protein